MNLSRQKAVGRRQVIDRAAFCVLLSAFCFLAGCGYTTRPGLATHLRTVYIKPLINKIDLTQLTSDYQHFPIYRPGMETDVTTAIINRFQFTGLLRPAGPKDPDSRLEGELVEFRRDALEALRQPLESCEIAVTRAKDAARFPARFMLVAAMNPCPCGYLGHPKRACDCTPVQVHGGRRIAEF